MALITLLRCSKMQQSGVGAPRQPALVVAAIFSGKMLREILLKLTQCSVSPQPFQYSYLSSKYVLDKFLIRSIAQQSFEQQ